MLKKILDLCSYCMHSYLHAVCFIETYSFLLYGTLLNTGIDISRNIDVYLISNTETSFIQFSIPLQLVFLFSLVSWQKNALLQKSSDSVKNSCLSNIDFLFCNTFHSLKSNEVPFNLSISSPKLLPWADAELVFAIGRLWGNRLSWKVPDIKLLIT